MAANASDPQPLAAVTRKKQWQMATSELRHGHQFAAQGYFAPLGHLQVSMVRRSRSAIRTTRPNANSANPIITGRLQGACCVVLGTTVDPSGHSVPESPVQAQRTLTAAVAGQTSPRNREDLQRISDANIRHGRQTKDKLAAQRHAAKVGRRVMSELKRVEQKIVDAGLMPDD